jgi:hypothetical protein
MCLVIVSYVIVVDYLWAIIVRGQLSHGKLSVSKGLFGFAISKSAI